MADNVVGGLELLHRKVLKQASLSDEDQQRVRFCTVGLHNQAMIALEDRLLVVKHGFMAGASGGGRKTTFHYGDVLNVEVNTGWVNAVIEVLTAAYAGGAQKDYWNSGSNNDPIKASNTIPCSKRSLSTFQPYLDQLNTWIREAKQAPHDMAQPAIGPSLVDQIRELHELVQVGALTPAEFEAAKAKLLAS